MSGTLRLGMLLGLALMAALIAREGIEAILAALQLAGWRILWLVPLHALPLLLDVLGWRALLAARAGVPVLLGIAAVREAVNRLLPVANIGGELVGIRLLTRCGVERIAAAASVVVEVMVTIASQYAFVVCGLACLLFLTGMAQLAGTIALLLALSLPLAALLLSLVRHGALFERLQGLAVRVFGARASLAAGDAARLDAAIGALCADRRRLLAAFQWQLLGFLAGASETWLVLRWLGHPVSAAEAVTLESLVQAARHFIFMIPAGLGTQEAGLVGLGYILGLGSDAAIALSLAKRVREIVFGLPALAAWYGIEGKREFQHARGRGQP
jgi:putative membrane protein